MFPTKELLTTNQYTHMLTTSTKDCTKILGPRHWNQNDMKFHNKMDGRGCKEGDLRENTSKKSCHGLIWRNPQVLSGFEVWGGR